MNHSAETIPSSISIRPWWSLPFIGIVAALVFFPNLGATHLWDEDEGFYASTAAEMMRAGQYQVPHFNGSLFAHKPPLMYWMMISGYHLFGINETGARFFSAVAGLLTVILVYQLGKQLFSHRVGLMSSLILATSVMITVVARSATSDLYLSFFVTLAVWFFVCAMRSSSENRIVATSRWYLVFYTALGLATLTKGPVGFLFPMASIGFFLMLERSRQQVCAESGKFRRWNRFLKFIDPRNFFGALWELRPITAIVVIMAVAAPWFVLVAIKTDGIFLREFFGVHHFQRALSSMEGHRGSIIYYPVSIMVGMYPWTVATLPMTLLVIRKLNSNAEDAKAVRLLGCWIGVYLVGFTFAGTKLPNYVLPAYPAIALLYGLAFETWIDSERKTHVFWGSAVLGVLVLNGMLIAIACPAVAFWSIEGKSFLDPYEIADDVKNFLASVGLIGVPAILFGALGIWLAFYRRPQAAFWSLFAAAFLTVFIIWNLIAPPLHQLQGTQRLIKRLRQDASNQDRKLAMFEFFRPSVVFYNRGSVHRCHDLKQVNEFFKLNPRGLMIAKQERYDSIFKDAEFSYRIVDRQSTFPDKGELVVFLRVN